MDGSSPVIRAEDLARTYDGGAYADPWDAVLDYRAATKYAGKHPDKGSAALSTALDLPRGRLRGWIDDGGAPDAVRAIETAREHGWINVDYDDAQFTALNALVANVFSGGSIAEQNYSPSFALNHRGEDSHVFDALELADVDYRVVNDRHQRADEVRPAGDGTVLGRVLTVLGAPVGPKAEQRLELPDYLDGAPDDVRETFVACYLENRAVEPFNGITKLREERNDSYLCELAALIEAVSGGPVRVSEKNVVLSKEATQNLGSIR